MLKIASQARASVTALYERINGSNVTPPVRLNSGQPSKTQMHPVLQLLIAISPLALCIAVIVLAYRHTK